jgi:uncharacterized protein (TIGR00251 family)
MALIIQIKVAPSSGKQKIILDKSENLKFYLKSPPEKGKANKELIDLLAEKLSCSKNSIEIVGGLTSRTKKIKIETDLTLDDLLDVLGFTTGQQKLFS